MAKDVKDLTDQVSMAVAALGVTFAQVLSEYEELPQFRGVLQRAAERNDHLLQDRGDTEAAAIVQTFVRALYDDELFP